jgi:chemotaxis protein methyltransferase CheR
MRETFLPKMSEADFSRMSCFINSQCGIKMPKVKKTMLEGRLQKRLRELNIANFKDYCELVLNQNSSHELIQMIDVVTTNKTDFFREPGHFDFLNASALPELLKDSSQLNIWSAGCSSGEEPYTIAMALHEYMEQNKNFSYNILGTDISVQILDRALAAIYSIERVIGIPINVKRKYFLKNKNPLKKLVRIVPELRSNVSFQRLNFMDDSYDITTTFDVVFCRNVLIYFDKPTQEKVINKLCAKLRPGGYFFLGHSESITDMKVPLKQVKPTIFKRI